MLPSRYLLICAHRKDLLIGSMYALFLYNSIPHIQYSVAYVDVCIYIFICMYMYIYIYAYVGVYVYVAYASIYPHPSSNYISKSVEEQTLNFYSIHI